MASLEARKKTIENAARLVRSGGLIVRRNGSLQQSQKQWTLCICPSCESGQLPLGAFRGLCSECKAYFSVYEERPEDRDKTPEWWARNEFKYPKPGKIIKVVRA